MLRKGYVVTFPEGKNNTVYPLEIFGPGAYLLNGLSEDGQVF